ncbi:hypothetical protein AMAG_07098 [Allomyces macrogynus ATCC 38327]|uniref:Sphingomyelin synthase-like domain-containing protein n=1 Tax=Allomyces macrogynus (strain ATCC 38327) TaxID=578462 RepID=A0A0L0SH41_ALLM3|nr:hypothetical protein AMAG_07098 [Allomyces macrogynus ATCC 38327]|eukprot:KNE61821.1 hypothetical protein AMAG_07098 [Allomyces macrogynus ATCC 38327]
MADTRLLHAHQPPTLPGAGSPPTPAASPPAVPDAVLLASSPTASAPVPTHAADPVPARPGSAPAVPTTAPRPTARTAATTANTTAATLPLPNSLPRSISRVSAAHGGKPSHRAAVRQWLRTRWPFWRSFYDLQLTLGAFVFIVICTYITCLANSTVDRTNPNNLLPIDQRRPLDDPAMHATFKLYRETGLPRNLSDTLVQLAAAMIILRGVTYGRYGCTVLRRAFYVGGIIYLLRAPTVLMTVLPNPLLDCVSHPNQNLFVDALLLLVQARYSCGDVFFSGHSIFYVVSDPDTVVVVVPAAHATNESGSAGWSGTPAATKMVQIPVASSGSPFAARSQQGAGGGSSSAVVGGGPRATSPVRHRAMSPSSARSSEKRGGGHDGSMHDLQGGGA